MHLRFLLALFSFLFFQSTPPAGDPPEGDPPANDPPAKPEFTPEQQKVINDWIAKERKKAEEDAAARLKAQADEAKRKADADAERKRQEAAGEFDKVKASLETERNTAVTERDSLQERLDTALKVISDTLAATWDGVPDEVRDLYDGPDDDPLTKQAFLAKPATQKLIERLTAGTEKPGNGPNPPPAGPRELNIEEEAAKARQRGGYRL